MAAHQPAMEMHLLVLRPVPEVTIKDPPRTMSNPGNEDLPVAQLLGSNVTAEMTVAAITTLVIPVPVAVRHLGPEIATVVTSASATTEVATIMAADTTEATVDSHLARCHPGNSLATVLHKATVLLFLLLPVGTVDIVLLAMVLATLPSLVWLPHLVLVPHLELLLLVPRPDCPLASVLCCNSTVVLEAPRLLHLLEQRLHLLLEVHLRHHHPVTTHHHLPQELEQTACLSSGKHRLWS